MTRLALLAVLTVSPIVAQRDDRPNILWIYVEDMNPWFGCYGDATVETPHVDALAARGVRFDRAYMPAGVCSATRSALITGAMQTTFGLHNHRSARPLPRGETANGEYDAIRLPDGVATIPELFRAAGYYTFNQGKTDYNFVFDSSALYDFANTRMNLTRVHLPALWKSARESGRPFFGQIQLRGGKNNAEASVDRASVTVPPYYPDIPLVREEIAHHYDCVKRTDGEVGSILAALDRDELTKDTIVFFFTDHGFRMHRHKQFLYEGGIRVPVVVAGPGITPATRQDLISGIDISMTSFALAGIAAPKYAEGRDLFAKDYTPREFVVAARDRCDYTIERIRAIVTPRFKYLRNYLTDRPYLQPQYRDPWPVTRELRRMAAAGELDAVQLAFYGEAKPAEELYDLQSDPHEIHNLVGDARHAKALEQHRQLLTTWVETTGDRGQRVESEAGLRAALVRWDDRCVNPEYAPVRNKLAAEHAGKTRALLLGDSISMAYTPFVKEMLFDAFVVVRPKQNCEGTTLGLQRVDAWLKLRGGDWDLIYFNFGLHDLKRVRPDTRRNSNNPDHPRQAEPEVYERQLGAITEKLVATGATLIYATTTPVPSGVRPHRDTTDPARYNAIARRVMARHGVPVHDLYAFAEPRLKDIQKNADVHFSPEGSRALAGAVAERLRAAVRR